MFDQKAGCLEATGDAQEILGLLQLLIDRPPTCSDQEADFLRRAMFMDEAEIRTLSFGQLIEGACRDFAYRLAWDGISLWCRR
ncbi:hypothetical protein GCM10009102_30360 [Sphingomonas insulae]|uniref:Uncharacterized protein n=1 Tax=Sphingomonas insulae TaxID=424800 RepID=A0ABN1HZI7_9SPHN